MEAASALLASQPVPLIPLAEEDEDDGEFEEEAEGDSDSAIAVEASEPRAESPRGEEDGGPRRKRRRRRGRRGGGGEPREQRESPNAEPHEAAVQAQDDEADEDVAGESTQEHGGERGPQGGENGRPRDGEPRRRRRGRRGGRRNRRDREGNGEPRSDQESGVRQPYVLDGDIAESTPTPRIEPVEVGQELGPLGGDDQPDVRWRRSRSQSRISSRNSRSAVPPCANLRPPSARARASRPRRVRSRRHRRTNRRRRHRKKSSGDEGKPRKTGWWAKRMFGEKG